MSNAIEERLTEPGGLANRLRTMRLTAGLSGVTLATRAGWAQSKVSRLENGRQMPTRSDVAAWVTACGADHGELEPLVALLAEIESDYQSWRRRQRHGQAAVQRGYAEMLAEATTVRYFETAFVPGLLQTRAYARSVMALLVEDAELDAAVSERARAQQALHDGGTAFKFLITEAVLHWWLCPPEAMRASSTASRPLWTCPACASASCRCAASSTHHRCTRSRSSTTWCSSRPTRARSPTPAPTHPDTATSWSASGSTRLPANPYAG